MIINNPVTGFSLKSFDHRQPELHSHTMSTPFVLRYIAEGEHQMQDFKMRIDDARKIARTLSAFANSDGGRLLIGVKDNGSISGVNAEEEIHMIQAAAEIYCKPAVPFKFQVWKVDYKTVLEVNIPASDRKPHAACDEENNWKPYIRLHDKTLPAPAVLLEVWRGKDDDVTHRYFHTEKEKKIFDTLQQYPGISYSALLRKTMLPKHILTKLLARFIRWDLIVMDFDQDKAIYKLK